MQNSVKVNLNNLKFAFPLGVRHVLYLIHFIVVVSFYFLLKNFHAFCSTRNFIKLDFLRLFKEESVYTIVDIHNSTKSNIFR